MFFLNPTYLWALLGLLIPVAIHLWSKKEGKTIKVGSTKLLTETESKKSSSIQLNEWFLLLLRMFLLAILVLLISGPNLKGKVEDIPVTYIIEPSLLKNDRIRAIVDTLEKGPSLRLLRSGFPEFEEKDVDQQNTDVPNYWKLAKEMETLQTDSIVVFTNAFFTGIKGKRPEINKKISWITFDFKEQESKTLLATQKENEIELLSALSTGQYTTFSKKVIAKSSQDLKFNTPKDSVVVSYHGKEEKLRLHSQKNITVLLKYADSLSGQVKYIEASLNAIVKYTNRPIKVSKAEPLDSLDLNSFDLIVWLDKDPIPATVSKQLIYRPDNLAHNIIEPGETQNVFYLSKRITSENVVEQHFTEQLLEVFDFYEEIEEEVLEYDKRTVDLQELLPIYGNKKIVAKTSVFTDISKWLLLLLVFGLVVERVLAKLRKQ